MDMEEFDHIAYAYRAWPGTDQDGVMARFDELVAYVDGLIAIERQAAWDSVNAIIKPGDLCGNGCDSTAQRNGLILASNMLFNRIHTVDESLN